MDVVKILEGLQLRRFHYILLLISCLVYGLTGMNVLLISVALPPIIKEWGLDQTSAGLLASYGYIGMFLGAVLSGFIADRVGRKYTLMLMIGLGSLFTGLCGLAWDYWSMALMRFIAGVGLGGTLPIPGVYMSEYPPARYRGRFVGIVETSWVYGAILSIFFGYILIPLYGWRTAFIPAYIPLLLIPFITFYTPESLRFLEKHGRIDEIKRVLKRYKLVEDLGKVKLEKVEETKTRILNLFRGDYLKRTILLWILWAVLVYTYHGIFIWLPSIYATRLGFTVVKSLYWVLIITLIQVPGYYSAAFLLDRIGRKGVLVSYLAIAGAASFLMATATSVNHILVYSALISFFNLGAWAGLYTYTPELYPTELRATGSGVAASVGRLAGIAAPALTGYLFAVSGGALIYAFTVFSAAHIVAALTTLALGIETRGKTLEEIAR